MDVSGAGRLPECAQPQRPVHVQSAGAQRTPGLGDVDTGEIVAQPSLGVPTEMLVDAKSALTLQETAVLQRESGEAQRASAFLVDRPLVDERGAAAVALQELGLGA